MTKLKERREHNNSTLNYSMFSILCIKTLSDFYRIDDGQKTKVQIIYFFVNLYKKDFKSTT